jgi:hypothetical protein
MKLRLHLRTMMTAMFVAGFLIPGAALAAGQGRTGQTVLRRAQSLGAIQRALEHVQIRSTRALARRSSFRSLDLTTSDALMNPWTDWPADASNEKGAAVDITKLDNPAYDPFASFHASTYANSQVLGGYLQSATVPMDPTTLVGTSYWLGTYYRDAAAASARVADMVSYFASQGVTPIPCISTWSACHLFLVALTASSTPQTDVTKALVVYSEGNVVGETLISTAALPDAATATALGVTLGKIAFGGDSALRAAFGPALPAGVAIDSVSLSHQVKTKLKATKSLKSGEKGLFEVVFHTTNAGIDLPTGTIVVSKGAKPVASGPLQTATQGNTSQIVLAAVAMFPNKTKKAVHLTAQVSLTLGTSTAGKSLKFTVKPKP